VPILKNAHRARIDERKLIEYVLNPAHPRGRDKARLFKAVLGYDRASSATLIEQIRRAIRTHEAVFLRRDRHGRHYRVDLILAGPAGSAHVRTGWIYDRGSDVPRLSTAFVLKDADQADV
jgi:hypothetical protein